MVPVQAETPPVTEDNAMEPTTSKTSKTETTAGAPTSGKNPKPGKKAKSAKEPKPKKERAPKQDLVVFAFRLPVADRDRIHAAAGAGRATRFVLSAALAAANADFKAFEALVAQAKQSK